MAKNKSQEQKQLVEAIGYFKALKENAPNTNPKIIEELDRGEGDLKDALYELLESKIPRSPVNL